MGWDVTGDKNKITSTTGTYQAQIREMSEFMSDSKRSNPIIPILQNKEYIRTRLIVT